MFDRRAVVFAATTWWCLACSAPGGVRLPATDGPVVADVGASLDAGSEPIPNAAPDVASDMNVPPDVSPDRLATDSPLPDGPCLIGSVGCQDEPAVPGLWQEFGGSATGRGICIVSDGCDEPAMVLDLQDNPVVAWSGGIGTTGGLRLRRWSGATWEDLGGSDTSSLPVCRHTRGGGGLGVGIGSDGHPLALCADFPANVVRWTGNAWVGLLQTPQGTDAAVPGPTNLPPRNLHVALAMTRDARPVVAWMREFQGAALNSSVHVRIWSGTAWDELGGSGTGTGLSGAGVYDSRPVGAVDAMGRPWIISARGSSATRRVMLKHWNGTAWDLEMDRPSPAGNGGRLALGILPDGRPVVAVHQYREATPPTGFLIYDVFVFIKNGQTWEGLGNSDVGTGVSRSISGSGAAPHLTVDQQGRITVVWIDERDIMLRRWNGRAWQELGQSASNGGISRTAGLSDSPVVAVRGSRTCVAWREEDARSVHVRCFSE